MFDIAGHVSCYRRLFFLVEVFEFGCLCSLGMFSRTTVGASDSNESHQIDYKFDMFHSAEPPNE